MRAIVPEDVGHLQRAMSEMSMRSLARAIAAEAIRFFERDRRTGAKPSAEAILKRRWPDDDTARIITRAASAPATTATVGWAQELTQVARAYFAALVPLSAAAQVIQASLSVSFDSGVGTVLVPGITGQAAGWTQEGMPIRVVEDLTSGPTMQPRKLGTIAVLTREMTENSNAEQFITQALLNSTAVALDAALFSNAAASAANPPGLLLGATSVAPSASGDLFDAMGTDVGALASAIGAYSGNGSLMLVGNAAQAARYLMYSNTPFPMAMSNTVAPGTVLAISLNALAAAVEAPMVEAMTMPSVHFDDSVPLPLGTASPAKSLWQSDSIGLRIKLPASWVIRNPAAISVAVGVKW
jgi:hypothetical protein